MLADVGPLLWSMWRRTNCKLPWLDLIMSKHAFLFSNESSPICYSVFSCFDILPLSLLCGVYYASLYVLRDRHPPQHLISLVIEVNALHVLKKRGLSNNPVHSCIDATEKKSQYCPALSFHSPFRTKEYSADLEPHCGPSLGCLKRRVHLHFLLFDHAKYNCRYSHSSLTLAWIRLRFFKSLQIPILSAALLGTTPLYSRCTFSVIRINKVVSHIPWTKSEALYAQLWTLSRGSCSELYAATTAPPFDTLLPYMVNYHTEDLFFELH